MNNQQFRNLLFGKDATKDGASSTASPRNAIPATRLGARTRPGIPMTPRSIGVNHHAEFARQLAERKGEERPQKKLRTSTPKGVKLAAGYVDRAKDRVEGDDDREERIKALEEALEKEEIDEATFRKLRDQIAGGDLSSTHLVKGLDFKLLERIRRGEDVYGEEKAESGEASDENGDEDEDDAFDAVLQKEVTAVTKEKREKKGQLSTAPLAPGKKRTRDQILADFRAAREAAMAKPEDTLGGRFKKIGAKQMPGSRIERDSKGREVLIIIDEDGHEKRKVRKLRPSEQADKQVLMMPDKNAKPLGMEVPEIYRKKKEPEEDDKDIKIFDDAGSDYDPLAGLGSVSSSDSDSDDEDGAGSKKNVSKAESTAAKMPPPPQPDGTMDYFRGAKTGLVSREELKAPSLSDPEIQAALKKAAVLQALERRDHDEDDDEEDKARRERRKRMLESVDRDAEDMDMGFGTSRVEDEDDFDESRVKYSEWGEDDKEDGQGGSRGGKPKRKRGRKHRKGDANNAADVLRVMEQRKAAGS